MYGQGYKFSCRKVKETFWKKFCNFSNCPVKEKVDANKKEIAENDQQIDKKYDGMYTKWSMLLKNHLVIVIKNLNRTIYASF